MTDSRVALGVDRLPWLTDETPTRREKRPPSMLGWTAAALLVVAGSAYWLGLETADEVETAVQPAPRPTVVAPLPELRPAQPPHPEVQVAPPPEVRPAPVPEVRSVAPPVAKTTVRKSGRRVLRRESPSRKQLSRTLAEQDSTPGPAATASRPVVAASPLRAWPARQSAGASGRLVQIGAFGTRLQAKRGWAYMARAYPGVRRLQAVVVETRNSRGRRFYRFQIGTTSQAHSEVLCQRMRKIRFSCAVVGLPGRAKVER
jgi:hypothetical protein